MSPATLSELRTFSSDTPCTLRDPDANAQFPGGGFLGDTGVNYRATELYRSALPRSRSLASSSATRASASWRA